MNTRYTVAILADVHGNILALEAVLEDLKRHNVHDIVCIGDLVMNGPRPKDTITCIRNANIPSVIGNTDLDVLSSDDITAKWTRDQLNQEDLAYIKQLPVLRVITPPHGISPQDDLMVFHSTPRSPFDLLILQIHPLGTTFSKMTTNNEIAHMLQGRTANLMVYGHIHYTSHKIVHDQRISSIGSVGFPFDGDQRAAYTVASWDGKMWGLTEYRVVYNYEQVAQELEKSTIPSPSLYARRIREANWFPRI
jgi:predicted phosphodiesterase